MKKLSRIFIRGLVAVVPLAVTVAVLYWLAVKAESLLGGFLLQALGERFYVRGMGLVAGVVLILLVGLLLQAWIVQRMFRVGERTFQRIPLVKSLYGSVRDLMTFFDSSKKKEFNRVVMVDFENGRASLVGMVTREDFSDVPAGVGGEDTIAVYLPMSYQMGGYTVMVPRSAVREVDMTIEDAMRFTLTAAMSSKKEPTNPVLPAERERR
ncbi:MAG: DUF502 domain-containing protein [Phycisphaerae bacterium]|nr:DUF502 domain-containing protein [Phycisphaerae bacterium]